VSAFETAFGVPAGHSLRLVRTALRGVVWEWEHEERDARGALVAVYESWSRGGASSAEARGGGGFVKYSPQGWVLRRSKADGLSWARPGAQEVLSAMNQPRSFRETVERWPT